MADIGPYETEREASRTGAVRAVCAAFDADPGVGKMAPHNTAMLTAACEAAGVLLGAYDTRVLEWMGTWEPQTCQVIAGLIARAAQQPEGEAHWGVRRTDTTRADGGYVTRYPNEAWARAAAAMSGPPGITTAVVCRHITPWKEADGA